MFPNRETGACRPPRWQPCHLAPPVGLLQEATSAHPASVAADGTCVPRRLSQLSQPQRHRRRLHRLLHDGHQLLAQLPQIGFGAQRGGERFQGTRCIVLATVEPPVDARLEAAAHRGEQRGDEQRGGHDDDGLGIGLVRQGRDERLEADHRAEVHACEDRCQRAVEQRAANDDVDVEEPVPRRTAMPIPSGRSRLRSVPAT